MTRQVRRLVVKFGTANLCGRDGRLDIAIFRRFAGQIIELNNSGVEVVIVSSGAIKAGKEALEGVAGKDKINDAIESGDFGKKELAGIGSRHLLDMWWAAFSYFYKEIAQVWVTYGNWENEGERQSIKSSILNYLKVGVIPVINENDVVSSEEIELMDRKISENDRLAGMIASLIGADAVLFLTDEGGIYESDPKKNPKTKMYEEVYMFATLEELGISDGVSESGTGGMAAKFNEASWCAKRGMQVAIAGNEDDVILKFVRGESVGTRIGRKTKFKEK